MNKYALTAIAASLVAAHSAMADVTVYGKANLSVQSSDEKIFDGGGIAQSNYELISNKSRFGLKGEEALNASIKAVYQMEVEAVYDSGATSNGQTFSQRNTFLGLAGAWGTVMAGIHDDPTKMLDKPIDLFNDLKYGDIENATTGEVRHKNMLMYRSPVMAGINFDVMVSPGEDKGSDLISQDAKTTAKDKRNDLVNAVSASVAYQLGGFKAALGVDSKVEQKLEIGSVDASATAANKDTGSKFAYAGETDAGRLVLSYDSAVFGVAGMYQKAKQSSGDVDSVAITIDRDINAIIAAQKIGSKTDAETFDTASLAAYYVLGAFKLKAMAQQTDFDVADTTLQQAAFGVDYKLGKNTTVFSYVAEVKADVTNKALNVEDYEIAKNSTFGVGIDHNF